ncbi:MAG: DnaJ domain-containing protein [Eubacteriales bacterium]|nr:DnaJ domain-containing protein [Eubacteriales bacterium]
MATDPYRILGVEPGASQEEIKAAYSRLAKRYHPDLHPGDRYAEQKMKEINAAYSALKYPGKGYTGYSSYEYSSYSRSGESYYSSGHSYSTRSSAQNGYESMLSSAAGYIRAGMFDKALDLLYRIERRTSVWYYYAAVAHLGTGDVERAAEYAERAHLMDPGNQDYARLDDRLNRGPVYSYTYSQPDAFSVIASSPGRIFLGILAIRLILRLILAFFIW